MYQLLCPLGHTLEIGPEHFGQRLMCPMCQAVVHASPPRLGESPQAKYEVQCAKGHILRVKQKYLGKEIRCPSCQSLVSMKPAMLLTSSGQPLGDTMPQAFKKGKSARKSKPLPKLPAPPPTPHSSRIPAPPPLIIANDTDDDFPRKPYLVDEDETFDPTPLPSVALVSSPTVHDEDFEFEVVDTQFNLELVESGIKADKAPKREPKRKQSVAPPVQKIPDTQKVPQQPMRDVLEQPAHQAPTGLQSLSGSEMMKVQGASSASTHGNTVQFNCPQGHLLELDVQYRGAQIQCPTCQLVFVWN